MSINISKFSKFKRKLVIIILGLTGYVVLSLCLAQVWPYGADYYYSFYPLARQWIDGNYSIYSGTGVRLFYPPWSLFVIIPLGLLPIGIAHGFQLAGSFIMILVSLHLFTHPKKPPLIIVALALLNLHSFDLYIRGQIDAIILLGIAIGYWSIKEHKPFWLAFGMCLTLMKPPLNVVLVLILYLLSIRTWSRKDQLISISLPIFMAFISSSLVGWDWPVTFLKNVKWPIDYLSITIWRGFDILNIPILPLFIVLGLTVIYLLWKIWNEGATLRNLSIAISLTFVFTIYANGDHYVLLLPAFVFVYQSSAAIGMIAYLTTFTPLLRLHGGYIFSSIDIIYPIILLVGSIGVGVVNPRKYINAYRR